MDREPFIELASINLGPGEWLVHLRAWVIQDGSHAEFSVGDKCEFALEARILGMLPLGAQEPEVVRMGDQYCLDAAVVFRGERSTVVDFGLLAYVAGRLAVPPALPRFRARFELDVDSLSFVGSASAAIPPLVYSWTVTGLWRKAAPFIPYPGPSYPMIDYRVDRGRAFVRDARQPGYVALDRTDAYNDDGGHASYILRCLVDADTPRRPISF